MSIHFANKLSPSPSQTKALLATCNEIFEVSQQKEVLVLKVSILRAMIF
jgi:hypothetical protein